MYNSRNNQGCLSHPIWTVIATIVAILSLLLAIFVWFVPNRNALSTAQQPVSTQLPASLQELSPTQQPSPTPAIPQLKPFYNGTHNDPGAINAPMTWSTNSQDQNGNINVTLSYINGLFPSTVFTCTGKITKDGRITLICKYNDGSTVIRFVGSLYPDGHIEGIETVVSGDFISPGEDTFK